MVIIVTFMSVVVNNSFCVLIRLIYMLDPVGLYFIQTERFRCLVDDRTKVLYNNTQMVYLKVEKISHFECSGELSEW